MKKYLKYLSATILYLSFFGCAGLTAEEKIYWDKAYNSSTKERFIPVELFTGGKWDGKHELILK